MNIFEKRSLSLILGIMLGAFSLFADFNAVLKLVISAIMIVALATTFIFEDKIQGSKYFVRIFSISVMSGVLLSLVWSVVFFPTRHFGNSVSVEARIYDIDDSSYNVRISLKTSRIDEKKDRHKLILYTDRETAKSLSEYDIIELTADLRAFTNDPDGFSGKSYYVSRGISGYIENAENVTVIANKIDKYDRFMENIRLKLSNTLKKRTDYHTGAFLSALIIGQRDELDGNTRLNFSRIGISHVLALSGMHLAILSIALTKLLMLLRVNKKLRIGFISLFTFGYMLLTGFSPSVVRAGVMLMISGALYLMSRSSDAITTLFIAVTVILVITPHAAYDLSLWLSAFATLGVIVFSQISKQIQTNDNENVSKLSLFLRFMKNGTLVSVFAFGATFAISATRFGGFSILSVITTLIFSFLIELMIYSGLFVLVIGWLIPIGVPVIVLSDSIKEFAEFLSDGRWVYISSNSILIQIMIAMFSALFFFFIAFDLKKKKLCVAIMISLLCITFGAAEITSIAQRYTDGVIYSPSASSGDLFIVKSNGDVTVIYSGKEYVSSAYEVTDAVMQQNITYIDRIVLANYSYTTPEFCEELLSSCKTDVIYAPIPLTKDEINQAEGVSAMLELWGAELRFYDLLESIEFNDCSLRFFDRHPYSYGEYPMNVFSFAAKNKSYTYISSGKYDNVSADSKALLYNSEHLFIGSGNAKYYKFDMILPDIKSINYAESNRLKEEALEYYKSLGADLNLINAPIVVD